jgi:hypothetical protein
MFLQDSHRLAENLTVSPLYGGLISGTMHVSYQLNEAILNGPGQQSQR